MLNKCFSLSRLRDYSSANCTRTWRQVGRPSPPHPSAPWRPTLVDIGAHPRKWKEHPPPNRDILHTLRYFGGWLGSGTKRHTRSTRLLGNKGRAPSHYPEGTKGRPSGRPQFLTTSRWPQHPPPRRQSCRMLSHGRLGFMLTVSDGRTTPALVPIGQQQHSSPTPVHHIRSEHVGRQAQPPPRQRRLAARPLDVLRDGHPCRPPHDRPLRLGAQHATPPLQRKLAIPIVRSGGLPSPRRYPIARGKQHVQPLLATTTRSRPKATVERRSIHNGRPPLARQSVAPSAYRVGLARDGHAGSRSLVPSREAARTRHNRQASLARQCLPDSLPAWLYLRRGAVSAAPTIFNTRQIMPAIQSYPARATKVRYKIKVAGYNNPCADSMRPYMQRPLGTNSLGAKASSY
jgi:hypothetical protein